MSHKYRDEKLAQPCKTYFENVERLLQPYESLSEHSKLEDSALKVNF
ncbi:MAG: hypothetical protein MJZ77_05970 [Bacteroidales bacterium]|nr:hypothetical protein [Bacteroidales bacterium]